jgi:hypothetical protein
MRPEFVQLGERMIDDAREHIVEPGEAIHFTNSQEVMKLLSTTAVLAPPAQTIFAPAHWT